MSENKSATIAAMRGCGEGYRVWNLRVGGDVGHTVRDSTVFFLVLGSELGN